MMLAELTQFEFMLLSTILTQKDPDYSHLLAVLPGLKVSSRQTTGVGAYISFDSSECIANDCNDIDLGLNDVVTVPDVPSGLGAVLSISSGKISYLELFTYGDELWCGNTDI